MESVAFTNGFVTGAGGGLGRAFALELARRGANVFVTDVNLAAADETAALALALGVRAAAAECDVRSAEAVESAARLAEATLGSIDLCINNAGVMVGGGIGTMPIDRWRFAIDVNLLGTIHGMHAFTPRFRARGGGRFVNVASIAGVLSAPETAAYNVSKAGVISLSETAYAELGTFGIGTTVLCPTAVRTGMFDAIDSPNPMHAALARKNATHVGPREPGDIARITLDAAARDRLYVFPQPDAKATWFVKRHFPRAFAWIARFARNRRWLEQSIES